RKPAAALLTTALIPASFFVWLVSDRFRAVSILQWHPGWAQDSADFAAPFFRMGGAANFGSATTFGLLLQKTWNGVIAPFFQFWLTNFGLWIPLALALVGLCVWRAWKAGWRWGNKPPADVAFVLPAVAIFAVGYFFKTAPWDWDNLKLMVWGYFLILPFLWRDIIGRWAFPERAAMCVALFGSGFVTLLGGLSAGHPGCGRPLRLLGPRRKDELPIKQPTLGSHVLSRGVRRLGCNLRSAIASPSALRRDAWFPARRAFHRGGNLPP